jgi:hypothetical protein
LLAALYHWFAEISGNQKQTYLENRIEKEAGIIPASFLLQAASLFCCKRLVFPELVGP